MPGRPRVSIVIPLFNKRATVLRTMESVLAQSLGDFEVLVIDDGSQDGGAELLKEHYSDPRIQIYTQENAGPGAARNHGLRVARGDFVTFLDADDTWKPELLEKAVETLISHPECGAFTSAYYLYPQGLDRWKELREAGFVEGVWQISPNIPPRELRSCLNAFHSCTAVYRKDALDAFDGFYEHHCTLGEDVYLWIQVLFNHSIYRCLEPLANYHTEDSELGIGGRKGKLPLEPVFTAPEAVRAACPASLRETLELWIASHAATAAFMQLEQGDTAAAAWLLKTFPRIRAWRVDYIKLRLRLANPTLWRLARTVLAR